VNAEVRAVWLLFIYVASYYAACPERRRGVKTQQSQAHWALVSVLLS